MTIHEKYMTVWEYLRGYKANGWKLSAELYEFTEKMGKYPIFARGYSRKIFSYEDFANEELLWINLMYKAIKKQNL